MQLYTIWVLKKPNILPHLSSRNAFRQGLVQGDKPVIYPILQWLFQNMDDLKKRAYLARYLVRIDIPPEQLADQDISELNETVPEILFTKYKWKAGSHI